MVEEKISKEDMNTIVHRCAMGLGMAVEETGCVIMLGLNGTVEDPAQFVIAFNVKQFDDALSVLSRAIYEVVRLNKEKQPEIAKRDIGDFMPDGDV